MFKRRIVGIVLVSASVILVAGTAFGGGFDPCNSDVTGGGCVGVCPTGDGPTLADVGATITVCINTSGGSPVADIPAFDIWLEPCSGTLEFCPGATTFADSATGTNGCTTISGEIMAMGHGSVAVVCRGYYIGCPPDCVGEVRSLDTDNTGIVFAGDNSGLSLHFPSVSGEPAYDSQYDFNCDDKIWPGDQAFLATHWTHDCSTQ